MKLPSLYGSFDQTTEPANMMGPLNLEIIGIKGTTLIIDMRTSEIPFFWPWPCIGWENMNSLADDPRCINAILYNMLNEWNSNWLPKRGRNKKNAIFQLTYLQAPFFSYGCPPLSTPTYQRKTTLHGVGPQYVQIPCHVLVIRLIGWIHQNQSTTSTNILEETVSSRTGLESYTPPTKTI